MNEMEQLMTLNTMLTEVLKYVQSTAGEKVIEISIDDYTSFVITKHGYRLRVLPLPTEQRSND